MRSRSWTRSTVGVDFLDDAFDGVHLVEKTRVAGIDDVDEEIGFAEFLEGGFEGFDNGVRELFDETHRVGEEELLVVWEDELPGGGVERGEELVGGVHFGAGEQIQKGGFSSVGVTDDCGYGPAMAAAAGALDGAVFAHLGKFALETADALLDAAAVDLELCFTGAARADAAALAGKVIPHAGEAGKEVLKLRELDLEAAFFAPRALGEDIQDKLCAVEDFPGCETLEVAALRGGKLVVENNGCDGVLAAFRFDFLDFSATYIVGGGGMAEALRNGADDFRAGGGCELGEFIHRLAQIPLAYSIAFDAYKERLFAFTRLSLKHRRARRRRETRQLAA
jgi:hypothetical protein